MQKEILEYIRKNQISPFNKERRVLKSSISLFKTADAKAVHARVIHELSSSFIFKDTLALWQCFPLGASPEKILERQKFFQSIPEIDTFLFKNFSIPKPFWNPNYGVIIVTEDEKTFLRLKEMECPVKFLVHEQDVADLESYDLVQVIECEQFLRILEQLPQSIFLGSIEEVYLERHVRALSGWKNIIESLATWNSSSEIVHAAQELLPLLDLTRSSLVKMISYEEIQGIIEEMNENLAEEIKKITLSGEALLALLDKSSLPLPLKNSLHQAILASGLPEHLFIERFPVTLNEEEFEIYIKKQQAGQHTSLAEEIRKKADFLVKIPEKLQYLSDLLILTDFIGGIRKYIITASSYPIIDEYFSFYLSTNLLLEEAQPISFELTSDHLCSILTGANSGGKTTLLEHTLQLVSLLHLGLPVSGTVHCPLFREVYYFAKNNGSLSKGAFETLLSQLASIQPGKSTLILADEIESVTEPGVAGMIICATARYFIEKNCFMILATHLGQEVQHQIPLGARIDGIEAKGLTETFELIVDHTPILGKLAHSTPELIIERLAHSQKEPYFIHLYESLKKEKIK